MQTTATTTTTKLNPNHEAYTHMNACLASTRVYDAHTAAEFVAKLGEVCVLTDPECQDVLRIMCNVSRVRQVTNKRQQRYLSHALNTLYKHAVERQPSINDLDAAATKSNKSKF